MRMYCYKILMFETKIFIVFFSGLREWKNALDDAEQCIKVNPAWGKGYYRKAVPLIEMGRIDEAKAILQAGLQKEPSVRFLLVLFADI